MQNRLLGKVDVIIDMVDAEAVIALAAGAIAEFQVGIVHIGAAADGALMGVEFGLLFPADAAGFLADR